MKGIENSRKNNLFNESNERREEGNGLKSTERKMKNELKGNEKSTIKFIYKKGVECILKVI